MNEDKPLRLNDGRLDVETQPGWPEAAPDRLSLDPAEPDPGRERARAETDPDHQGPDHQGPDHQGPDRQGPPLSLGEAAGHACGSHQGPGKPDRKPQDAARPNSGWGRALGAENGWRKLSMDSPSAAVQPQPGPAAPIGGPPSAGGGSWHWQPAGSDPKPSWRKRHPILFWGGALLVLALIFGLGRMTGSEHLSMGGSRIAVVMVDGMILDAQDIVQFMEKVGRDPSVKGVILRINSPGGAVGPSQEIFAAAKRLAKKMPVVSSMGAVAASGGYYAALAGQSIIAGPSTLTASIGVKLQVPNFEGLMRTVGVSETTLTTGRLKDAGSSWREMRPEEEAYFQALIADMYDEFVETVAKERDLTLEQVRAVADGRAMTGRQALAAGLIDELGDLTTAVAKVKSFANIPASQEMSLLKGPEKPSTLLTRLVEGTARAVMRQSLAAEQPILLY